MDALTLRDTAIAALTHLDVDITDGEPITGPDGRIRRTIILGVTTGVAANRRAAGGTVDLTGAVTALIVTPTRDSCLWLTERTRDALTDMPITGGARLTDVSYDGEPLPEPDIAPARWSRALTFNVTRKRNRYGPQGI